MEQARTGSYPRTSCVESSIACLLGLPSFWFGVPLFVGSLTGSDGKMRFVPRVIGVEVWVVGCQPESVLLREGEQSPSKTHSREPRVQLIGLQSALSSPDLQSQETFFIPVCSNQTMAVEGFAALAGSVQCPLREEEHQKRELRMPS